MVPTDHDIPFSRTFQGLLRYIFKDFSRTFLCSFKHIFTKKRLTMDFSNKTYRGGGGDLHVFSTFLDDLLYYGYQYRLKQICLKEGVWGSSPRKKFY